jgi:adenine-specific DNA-methyltransferase
MGDSDADPQDGLSEPAEEEFANQVRGSYFYKQSQVSVKALRELMGAKIFDNPKDHDEIGRWIDYTTSSDPHAVVMDFFAGSGTVGQSILDLNRRDGGRRRFILVQLAEKLDAANRDQKSAASYLARLGKPLTIAELTKERLRRAGAQLATVAVAQRNKPPASLFAEDEVTEKPPIDVGFRVLKVDTSNMKDVYYSPDAVSREDLFRQVENIKPDRTSEDLLFQVLLDWGVDLGLPIVRELIDGKEIFFVDQNAIVACFDTDVTEDLVRKLAARKPLRAVFRDSGFTSDAVKINAEQIFRLLSPDTQVRVI